MVVHSSLKGLASVAPPKNILNLHLDEFVQKNWSHTGGSFGYIWVLFWSSLAPQNMKQGREAHWIALVFCRAVVFSIFLFTAEEGRPKEDRDRT